MTDGVDVSDQPVIFGPFPGAIPADVEREPLADEPDDAPPRRVVGLGALCDVREPTDDPRGQSFSVAEFVLLADGRRVTLHDARGYTLESPTGGVGDHETVRSVTRDVLNVVIPDDGDVDAGEEHPWSWLAELARARGLDVTADDLRVLPYEVVLSDDVLRWLHDSSGSAPPGSST
jgi:hypothetical protein